RRHTRSDRDWSSDVCSSDLSASGLVTTRVSRAVRSRRFQISTATGTSPMKLLRLVTAYFDPKPLWGGMALTMGPVKVTSRPVNQIGRASCRERVEMTGVLG